MLSSISPFLGSSFFGELLNQHPDVFYVFEPLILVSQLYRCDDDVAIKKQILKDLSQCNTPNWMQIYAGDYICGIE